jgi:hypothetical protein
MSREGAVCPSASHTWPDAELFGVVGGAPSDPRVSYLSGTVPVDDDVLALTAGVEPGQVLRVSAPCAESGCVHWADRCRLADGLVELLPTVTNDLPVCAIRQRCVWWRQEGRDACLRCPQVATVQTAPSTAARQIVEHNSSAH